MYTYLYLLSVFPWLNSAAHRGLQTTTLKRSNERGALPHNRHTLNQWFGIGTHSQNPIAIDSSDPWTLPLDEPCLWFHSASATGPLASPISQFSG